LDDKINIDDLITHRLSLVRIKDGLVLMKRRESVRSEAASPDISRIAYWMDFWGVPASFLGARCTASLIH